ncbi:MAG: alpha/beta fold hydrolase [Marinomonas sp.]
MSLSPAYAQAVAFEVTADGQADTSPQEETVPQVEAAAVSPEEDEEKPAPVSEGVADGLKEKPAEEQQAGRPDIPDIDANGRPGLIPTSAFAGRAQFTDAKLSPDGSKFAFRQQFGKVSAIVVVDADNRDIIAQFIPKGFGDLMWFRWAGNEQILFSNGRYSVTIGAYKIYAGRRTRMRVFDLKDETMRDIKLEKQGAVGDDVLFVDPHGRYIVWAAAEDSFNEPDVWRFPLDGSGQEKAVMVQKRLRKVDDWWADDTGTVRLGVGYTSGGSVIVYYRPDGKSKFERVTKMKKGSDQLKQWNANGIFAGSDEGFALVEGENGRSQLHRFNYATSEPAELIYANPEWDVDAVAMDPTGKPVGVSFTDDKIKAVWFDETLAKEQRNLEAALGAGDVSIISFAGYGRMLVYHSSAGDPGALYIYTPAERRIDLFADVRPAVDYRLLATPRAITYQARDGTDIRAFVTLPKGRGDGDFPLIILPHGGPFGVRDSLAYDDEVQFLANRGYAVLQPNFRGSGGYGDEFYELGIGQVGRAMQDDIDDAMDWAVAEGLADPKRVCVVGGSYGGYAALWAVLRNPERYRCAASWAGVTDWKKLFKHDRNYLTRKVGKRFRSQIEGDDDERDLNDYSPYRLAHRLNRPVLLAHGTADPRVPISQFELMKKAAENAPIPLTTLKIKGEGHSFSKAENEQAWYDALESFLAEHNPAD